MQSKKNEKVDLTKNSSLYFVIGLATNFYLFHGKLLSGKPMRKIFMGMRL